jgi:NAD(P)-dependent dehydrogenase (short-subunit alcohol dehydrogenase family)
MIGGRVAGVIDGTIEKASIKHDNRLPFAKHALKRVGKPIDVVRVAAFLLSGDASFVTGAFYLVDGGLLASY